MVSEQLAVSDVDVASVWDTLKSDASAQLIDVRTTAEWTFVGIPDLSSLHKEPMLIQWQSYPSNQPDASFAQSLDAELTARGLDRETNLYFICRSGARSLSAARTMVSLGYSRCHNVRDGFEGPINSGGGQRHRSELAGWKFSGLPWTQS